MAALTMLLVSMTFASCRGGEPGDAPPWLSTTQPHGVLVTPTGIVAPVVGRVGDGFWVRTPCWRLAYVSDGRLIERADVVIDPGHGGKEHGAEDTRYVLEKDVNLAVGAIVADDLRADGLNVVTTRTSDDFMTLRTRADIATALQPRAFVSVHHNAGADAPLPHPGAESYYQYSQSASRRLAQLLYEEVLAAVSTFEGIPWIGATDAGPKYRLGDDGDYYGILRNSMGVPAAIIEGAYVSNPPPPRGEADDHRRVPAPRR